MINLGFVNEKLLKELMPAPGKGKVFVCKFNYYPDAYYKFHTGGPPPMMNAISGPKAQDYSQGEIGGALKNLGYTSEQIVKV